MERNVSLAIGVARAGNLDVLNGAINGARAFHEWASAMGYESHLLIDDPGPVNVDDLQKKLDSLLSMNVPIHRLLLYFCGHGVIQNLEDPRWFLSEWNTRLECVYVELMRYRLARHFNIQQIAIFADACSSLPESVDIMNLTPHGVVIAPKVAAAPDKAEMQVDRFDAAQDGIATFMIPFEDPNDDRGLFSGVLLEALWGAQAAAFSKFQNDKITSGSLGSYLRTAIPAVAKKYNRIVKPRISPAFDETDDIYFEHGKKINKPKLPEWPSIDIGNKTKFAGGDIVGGDKVIVFRGYESVPAAPKDAGQKLLDKLDRRPIPGMEYDSVGIKLEGGDVKQIWVRKSQTPVWQSNPAKDQWLVTRGQSRLSAEPVLVEYEDGMFAALTSFPGFTIHVVRDGRSVPGLLYRSALDSSYSNRYGESALAAMENGTLRSDQLIDLATGMREGKHIDPMLGVISAYLYDSINDIGNIRRMAYFYVQNGQAIPYDIALLAQARAEMRKDRLWLKIPAVPEQKPRTDSESRFDWTYTAVGETEGVVGGFWPWMRQGWLYLEEPLEIEWGLINGGLKDVIRRLCPGRFVMLDADGGKMLCDLFGLQALRPEEIFPL